MTKNEYAKSHGLKVRKPTKEERLHATKGGATAKYVIETPSGHSYWSQNGTMNDLRTANNASNTEIKKQQKRAAQQGGGKDQTAKKTTAAKRK